MAEKFEPKCPLPQETQEDRSVQPRIQLSSVTYEGWEGCFEPQPPFRTSTSQSSSSSSRSSHKSSESESGKGRRYRRRGKKSRSPSSNRSSSSYRRARLKKPVLSSTPSSLENIHPPKRSQIDSYAKERVSVQQSQPQHQPKLDSSALPESRSRFSNQPQSTHQFKFTSTPKFTDEPPQDTSGLKIKGESRTNPIAGYQLSHQPYSWFLATDQFSMRPTANTEHKVPFEPYKSPYYNKVFEQRKKRLPQSLNQGGLFQLPKVKEPRQPKKLQKTFLTTLLIDQQRSNNRIEEDQGRTVSKIRPSFSHNKPMDLIEGVEHSNQIIDSIEAKGPKTICNQCNIIFSGKSELHKHIEISHSDFHRKQKN